MNSHEEETRRVLKVRQEEADREIGRLNAEYLSAALLLAAAGRESLEVSRAYEVAHRAAKQARVAFETACTKAREVVMRPRGERIDIEDGGHPAGVSLSDPVP